MARPIKGRIFKRGKKDQLYLQYYLNGKQIVVALKDEKGQSITNERKAQQAADIILAPYRAKNEAQRRKQAANALKDAEDKAKELEQRQNAIKIVEAHSRAMQKPRRLKISKDSIRRKGMHWNDFATYMTAEHPDTTTLDKVTKSQAEAYTQHLIEHGKYVTTKSFKRKNKTSTFKLKSTVMSPRTINSYLVSINEIFNLLADDGGYSRSPFADIPKQKLIQDKREAFTLKELKKIREDGDEFIVPLFTVGLCTGLREADICLLEWKEVDMAKTLITRTTRKTGAVVNIPIMPQLMQFLQLQQPKSNGSKYVLPEHAAMYLKNPSGITWRVKRKLEELKIESTRVPEGRARAVSIKDVHSLRHSFCYYAGVNNVPIAIVQAIVGHMSEDMTKHYTAHVTAADSQKALEKASDIFDVMSDPAVKQLPLETQKPPKSEELERQQFHQLADALPIEAIREILKSIKQ
jgi:integrase